MENLLLQTSEPRAALGFYITVINGQSLWSLCCLVQDSVSRTELRSYAQFLNEEGWALGWCYLHEWIKTKKPCL